MLYKNVCIEALGYELPTNIVKSLTIEERLAPVYEKLNLSYGRLEMISGIKERRFWDKGTKPSQVSIKAGEKALNKAGIGREDVECLINASVSRDFMEPSTACIVHHGLGLSKHAILFDVSNACLGFVNSMAILANMIELGQVKTGLVTAGEVAEHLIDSTIEALVHDPAPTRAKIKSSFASLTIASGAVAIVMTHKSISNTGYQLLGGAVRNATEHNRLCCGGENYHYIQDNPLLMNTHAESMMEKGCLLAKETWEATKKELEWADDDPQRIFCHQVGSAHRKLLYETLGLDVSKDFSTFETLGNIGSASAPITFAIGLERGLVEDGDKIAIFGIGSGLDCLMFGVQC
ncbi:MAG: 3-oxoacyl-ACP synthase III [bacterium]